MAIYHTAKSYTIISVDPFLLYTNTQLYSITLGHREEEDDFPVLLSHVCWVVCCISVAECMSTMPMYLNVEVNFLSLPVISFCFFIIIYYGSFHFQKRHGFKMSHAESREQYSPRNYTTTSDSFLGTRNGYFADIDSITMSVKRLTHT